MSLPESIDSAAELVKAITGSLIAAATAGDTDAIHHAIQRRAEAVESLQAALGKSRETLADADRDRLLESLALQAQDAECELTGLQQRVREDLLSITQGVRAARGYNRGSRRTDRLSDPSSLDRSG